MQRRIAIWGGVGLLGLVACNTPMQDLYRPPPGVNVQHYSVVLSLDPETRRLEGSVMLDVRHQRTVAELPLCFAAGMTIDSARVGDQPVQPVRRGERLVLPLSGSTRSQLTLWYHGIPEEGLYAKPYINQTVIFTDSWPYRGCGWLPAVHHPSDPATLDLTLIVPIGYKAIGSGRLVRCDTLSGRLHYRWRLDASAPTYSFAFAVGDFVQKDTLLGDTLQVSYVLLASDRDRIYRFWRTPEALQWFSRWLGPYPYRSYAVVQVPIDYAGMENASAPFLRADLFELDDVEGVQVHELVHQWFGNHVTIANWRDLWLSEGAATYLTTLFYEATAGIETARQQWVDMARLTPEALRLHGALVPGQVVDPEVHLTWVPYRKGACVLHLLRLKLGDAVFRQALQTVYQRFAGRPLSTEGFRAVLEELSRRDLGAVFAYWVYSDRLPTLHVRWEPTMRRLSWQVTGDNGTLAGIPFLLAVRQGDQVQYVEAQAQQVWLAEAAQPEVHPVGILLQVKKEY